MSGPHIAPGIAEPASNPPAAARTAGHSGATSASKYSHPPHPHLRVGKASPKAHSHFPIHHSPYEARNTQHVSTPFTYSLAQPLAPLFLPIIHTHRPAC